MTYNDIFKKSFLNSFSSDIPTMTIAIALLVTLILGLYIFLVYSISTRKNLYSKSFNMSLVILAVITAAVILTIQSSIVVSLGMVGALSIVRFRTAIKNPMDLVFLFWSISTGIICGAGLFKIAVALAAVVTLVLLFLEIVPSLSEAMILVVNSSKDVSEEDILSVTKKFSKGVSIKSSVLSDASFDMIIEVRVKDGSSLLRSLKEVSGVNRVSLMKHDGEATF